MSDSNEVRKTVVGVINKVRTDSGRESIEPKDDDTLMSDIGLDSLDLAQLVAELEKALGVDPFRDGSATARTLIELVTVYEKAKS